MSYGIGWHIRAWGIAWERAPKTILAMMVIWLLYPVLVMTTAYWQDAAGLSYYLHGRLVPRFFSQIETNRAALSIFAAWVLLLLVTFVITIRFFRRVQLPLALWPMCFFTVAGICNFVWFFEKGVFDPRGAIAGTAPVVVLAIFQVICDRVGAAFVFGGAVET